MDKWKKTSIKTLNKGFRDLQLHQYELPNGKKAGIEIRDDGQCVAIFAMTPDQQVVLAKQFRPGPDEVLVELPGGGMEAGEDPAEAAARELLEETGYAGRLQFVTTSWENPYTTLLRHNFVALDCKKVAEPQLDEHEIIETVLVPLKEYRQQIKKGQGTDIETAYLMLDHLGLL